MQSNEDIKSSSLLPLQYGNIIPSVDVSKSECSEVVGSYRCRFNSSIIYEVNSQNDRDGTIMGEIMWIYCYHHGARSLSRSVLSFNMFFSSEHVVCNMCCAVYISGSITSICTNCGHDSSTHPGGSDPYHRVASKHPDSHP